MSELNTDNLVVEGESVIELVAAHPEFSKTVEYINELLNNGFKIGPKLFLIRENIADILNILSSIDIDYNNIDINKREDGFILFFDVDLKEVLRKPEFITNIKGLWMSVSVYCMTNDDYKFVKKLIKKYGMDILGFHVMFGRRHTKEE